MENRKAKFEPNNKVSALDVKKERERAAEQQVEGENDDEEDDDEHSNSNSSDGEDMLSESETENLKKTEASDKNFVKESKAKSKKPINSKSSEVNRPITGKQGFKAAKKDEQVQKQELEDKEEEEEEGEAFSENEWVDFDDDGNALSGSPPPAIPAHIVESPEEASKPKSESKAKSAPKDPEAIQRLRDQLAARVREMREKRKAPGSGVVGAPSSRDAILAARQQKKRKREPKSDNKKEESDDEIIVEDDDDENNDDEILFGSVQFKDGQKTTSNLKGLATEKKLKRRDLASQLRHVEAKKAKIAALDSDKRAAIEEKGQWSRAILQAEGTKIKDNEKLLKKSLKQQQQKKRKSEREWRERKETVAQNIANKQNKREKNLAMRKEMKGVKGKTQRAKIQKKLRAGFEGKKR